MRHFGDEQSVFGYGALQVRIFWGIEMIDTASNGSGGARRRSRLVSGRINATR